VFGVDNFTKQTSRQSRRDEQTGRGHANRDQKERFILEKGVLAVERLL